MFVINLGAQPLFCEISLPRRNRRARASQTTFAGLSIVKLNFVMRL